MALARSRATQRRLRQLGSIDGVIQVGSEFTLPGDVRYVTFDDMTIAQVLDPELRPLYPPWDAIPDRTASALRRRQQAIYTRAATCVTASHWAAESVIRDYGIPPERVAVAGIGAHVRAPYVDRDWSLPRFLFIGVDWERKNGAAVVRAFNELRLSHPDARLDVIGGHPRLDVPGVTGHGYLPWYDADSRPKLERLLQSSTCLVMPSLHEAAGIVYVEAAVSGVPAIGSTRGGARTLLGSAGRLVDPTDAAALTHAMTELADPLTAARMGAMASAYAERLTWELVGWRLLRALRLPQLDPDDLPDFL